MAKVGVVRNKDTIQSVRTAVLLAGGMKIEKNSTVLIRPNANTADYPPGSTNPEVLKGAIHAVKEYDPAKIIVGEKSMTTLDTIKVMKHLDLYHAAGNGTPPNSITQYPFLPIEHEVLLKSI